MRAVVQRAGRARVRVDGHVVGEIGKGCVVLLGISTTDGESEASWMADKISGLRIWPDEHEKMNLSLAEVGGQALVVSQFTLYGDARKGRRPSFVRAAQGPEAERIYDLTVEELDARGIPTATGAFGAMMDVELVNSGPVTILLDSDRAF